MTGAWNFVTNFGILQGEIDLGSGTNSFSNQNGALIEATKINIGAGNTFVNSGVFSPGGYATVRTTAITGNYLQPQPDLSYLPNSAYLATLAGPASADRVNVTGTAQLRGSVVVNRTGSIGNTGSVTIMTSDGTMTNNITSVTQNGWQYAVNRIAGSGGGTTYYRYDLANCCGNYVVATSSMVGDGVNWSTRLYVSDGMGGYTVTSLTVLPTSADQLVLSWNRMSLVNFVDTSLLPVSDQQINVAAVLASAEASSPAVRNLNDALLDTNPTLAAFIMNFVLMPEAFVASLNSWWQASNGFSNAVNSCPTLEGSPGLIKEGQCYWAKVGGRQFDWDATSTNSGGHDSAFNMSGGVQVALRDEWRLGFAGFYEHSNLNSDAGFGAETESDRFQGAVVIKNRWDNLSVSASAFAGYGWSDTERTMFGLIGTAKSGYGTWLTGANLRVSQLFEMGGHWYVKPMIDLNATMIATEDFQEHGATGANLAVKGDETWILTASPAIEIGTEIQSGGILYRPFLRAGGTFFDDATYDVTASFVAVPGHFFTASEEFDESFVDLSAGVDIVTADGVDLKLTYDGRFSENSDMHAAGAKAAIPF